MILPITIITIKQDKILLTFEGDKIMTKKISEIFWAKEVCWHNNYREENYKLGKFIPYLLAKKTREKKK